METDYIKMSFSEIKGNFRYKTGEVIGTKSKVVKKIEIDMNLRVVKLTCEHLDVDLKLIVTTIQYPFENIICMETFEQSGRP